MNPTTKELINYINECNSTLKICRICEINKYILQGRLDVYEELYGKIINMIEEEDYDERLRKTDKIFLNKIQEIKAVLEWLKIQ